MTLARFLRSFCKLLFAAIQSYQRDRVHVAFENATRCEIPAPDEAKKLEQVQCPLRSDPKGQPTKRSGTTADSAPIARNSSNSATGNSVSRSSLPAFSRIRGIIWANRARRF
jgi:hypothetical protein